MLIANFDINVYQLRTMILRCIQYQLAVFYFSMMIMKCILLRVEAAFHKFDTDGDGFIDWEEFKQVDFR